MVHWPRAHSVLYRLVVAIDDRILYKDVAVLGFAPVRFAATRHGGGSEEEI